MRDDRTMFLFTFADEDPASPIDIQSQKELVRKRFEANGWECAHILAALDTADDFYFDRVSQIRMDTSQGLWTLGRVTLIGDAASCVSLLAGQGTALAMVAAYILAGELSRCGGDYAAAFRRYQELFGPFVVYAETEGRSSIRRRIRAEIGTLARFLRNQLFRLHDHPLG